MKKFFVSLVIILVGYRVPSVAQKVKMGFVGSEYIVSLLPETQAAQQDIASFEREWSNKLAAMRQGLNIQAAQLQQEASTLSDTVRAEREKELQLLQQDIAREQQTAQQQLQFKEIQMMSPLRQKVGQTIDSVAQANGYTHVFSDTMDSQPVLIYAKRPEEADLTPLVIEALGITAPADTTGQ